MLDSPRISEPVKILRLPTVTYGDHTCQSHTCKAKSCDSCLPRAVEGAVPGGAQHAESKTLEFPKVHFGDHTCELRDGSENVLDALLRTGIPISHACKAGACGSCLMRAVEGTVPPSAQQGLKESWKAKGYLLACICRPAADLRVELPGADARLTARIESLDWLSADVLRVRLLFQSRLDFRAGQYVTLRRSDGLARSYSIANVPGEESILEHHVRRIPNGNMSNWLATEARQGDSIDVTGPAGECFYVPGRPQQPLLLVGTGTGLAPLYGILHDALAQGHQGQIHLFHGASRPSSLYLQSELSALAEAYSNFTYTPAVVEDPMQGMAAGAIDEVVLDHHPKLSSWRGFTCGNPRIVSTLKKKLFLAGMDLRDIFADAFVPAASPQRM